ncbi:hypothetical protein ACFVZD_40705 [Streptomyces sp. NPDC058287]|uniref:hypothetical protein n=1 Tax=Streptomyces sp. NPDC058287 TaxID=3346423 RepID=UPI0036EE6A49
MEAFADLAVGQGAPGVPILALPQRVATSSRTRLANGAGRSTGEVPNVIETVSPSKWTSSTVSWLMVAISCA